MGEVPMALSILCTQWVRRRAQISRKLSISLNIQLSVVTNDKSPVWMYVITLQLCSQLCMG